MLVEKVKLDETAQDYVRFPGAKRMKTFIGVQVAGSPSLQNITTGFRSLIKSGTETKKSVVDIMKEVKKRYKQAGVKVNCVCVIEEFKLCKKDDVLVIEVKAKEVKIQAKLIQLKKATIFRSQVHELCEDATENRLASPF